MPSTDPGACTIDPFLLSNSSALFDIERRISAGADWIPDSTKSVEILTRFIVGEDDSEVIELHDGLSVSFAVSDI
jgi:hypothetical protein